MSLYPAATGVEPIPPAAQGQPVAVGKVIYPGMVEFVPNRDPEKYEVCGADMQVLNLSLNGGEKVQSVPGALNYMDPNIQMSVNCNQCFGRFMSCSSCIMTDYTNYANNESIIGLTPNFPAKVVPLVVEGGVTYRAKDGAYFASIGNVDIGYNLDCCSQTCLCGGQGCVRQTVGGQGTAFVAAMGTIMTKELAPGEKIIVDTHSLVVWSDTVKMDIRLTGGCCTCCCAGEGMFNTVLEGPGTVYFQSLSIQKFKRALQVQAAQQGGEGAAAGGPDNDSMAR